MRLPDPQEKLGSIGPETTRKRRPKMAKTEEKTRSNQTKQDAGFNGANEKSGERMEVWSLNGKFRTRIGVAFVNDDRSISVLLNALPIESRMLIAAKGSNGQQAGQDNSSDIKP